MMNWATLSRSSPLIGSLSPMRSIKKILNYSASTVIALERIELVGLRVTSLRRAALAGVTAVSRSRSANHPARETALIA